MNSKFFSLFVFATFTLSAARADDKPAPPSPAVDPQADTVLRGLADHFTTIDAFRVELEAQTRLESEDMKQAFTTRATLTVQRPAKLAITVKNPMIGSLFLVCDGSNTITFLPALNRYSVRPAPKSLELLSQDMGAASPVCLPVISALLEREPYEALVKEASRIVYAGRENRGDADCHRLTFTHADFDCDAWISAGPRPVLVAVKPHLARLKGKNGFPAAMHAEVEINLNAWEIGGRIPDAAFALAIPADAQKTDTLFPVRGEPAEADAGGEEEEAPDPAQALRLKPAPAFTLPLLGGGAFDLAAHKGKAPVMLLFWTSWAGPCRLLLPVFDKLARAYADKGLVCVSINEQESGDEVAAFLRDTGLKVPVALDTDSRTAALYQIAGIPQLVLIDKAGVVRESYIGYGQSLEDEVRVVLDALTATGS